MDLQCGIRLVYVDTELLRAIFFYVILKKSTAKALNCEIPSARRTMELLTKNWNLSKQLRVPAISRLQKMHNVDIVLNVLKERGIHLEDGSGKA